MAPTTATRVLATLAVLLGLAAAAGAWDVLVHGRNPALDGRHKARHKGLNRRRVLLFSTNYGSASGAFGAHLETEDEMDLDTVVMSLRLTDGKGEVEASVYAASEPRAGKKARRELASFRLSRASGQGSPEHVLTVRGTRGAYLGVTLKGRKLTRSNKFELRVQRPRVAAGELPLPPAGRAEAEALGPVCGFADLHAHLTAERAFGGSHFKAGVEGGQAPPKFVAKLSHVGKQPQQMTIPELRRAHRDGLNVVVASAVNNEFLCLPTKYSCNDMSSALRQTRYALELAERHKDFMRVVRDPYEARRAIHDGYLAVVLGVEVSNLMPGNRGLWRDQLHELYDLGVRTMLLVHEFNSIYAGAAPHAGILEFAQALQTGVTKSGGFDRGADGYNSLGLTPAGRELVREMVRLRMVLDVAHLGVHSMRDVAAELAAIAKEEGLAVPVPFMNSHSRFAEALTRHEADKMGEFFVSAEQARLLKAHRGMVGVRNGAERTQTVVEPNDCDGTSTSVLQLVQWGVDHGVDVALGSDLNGHAGMNGPRRGPNACFNPPDLKRKREDHYRQRQRDAQVARGKWVNSEHDTEGMAHVGLEGDLLRDLYQLGGGRGAADAMANSAERFLRLWERTHRHDRGADAPLHPVGPAQGDGKMQCADYRKAHPLAGAAPAAAVDRAPLGPNFEQPKGPVE